MAATGLDQVNHGLDSPFDQDSIPPMTWSLMGRFFAVPFLIISLIVAGAIVVVFLFGGPASPERRSINELLTELESSSGQRSAGVLLPREKQLWQMGLELSLRLEKKESELTPEELQEVTTRLVRMVESQIVAEADNASVEHELDTRAIRSRRLEFLIHALGRTERPEAVSPLIMIVKQQKEPYVGPALVELGNLHKLPEARSSVGDIVELLARSPKTETAMVAATALSVLADPGDPNAISALKKLMHGNDGELSWSAAMALARLGDSSARSVLLDLLDRSFWQDGERYQVVDPKGNVLRYPMPPQRIDALLMAAIDAASHLPDKDLWAAIDTLKSDPTPGVRAKAEEAASRRSASVANG